MSILIDIRQPEWLQEEALRDLIARNLNAQGISDVAIYCHADDQTRPDVIMLATSILYPGVVSKLPNLQLVQKLGAGVESIVQDPDLPMDVRIARLKPTAAAQEIAEYCLTYVLRDQRNLLTHHDNQSNAHWQQLAPRQSSQTVIGILGLGHIGGYTAMCFAQLGYQVIGWSRTEKSLNAIECIAGADALPALLARSDYVLSVLPSTTQTQDLFNLKILNQMKPTSMLINVGRGDLIVDDDLLSALEGNTIRGAVLDVFRQEPLPESHPFWAHPNITVTPHVSGWHIDDGLGDVAENYKRLINKEPLLHEVDRSTGY